MTWGSTVAAGWEISVWLRASPVLQSATSPPPQSARPGRSCATWVSMLITAGWETTACLRDQNVLPLLDSDQCLLSQYKYFFSGKITFLINNWK